jgi:hypothetical protein
MRLPTTLLQEGTPAPSPDTSAAQTPTIDEIIGSTVLDPLRIGLENGNRKQALSAFDPKLTQNYPDVRDQFVALSNSYAALRLRYRIVELIAEGDHATATCEMDMDATPRDESLITRRRSVEMHLQLKQTAAGWKIISFTPADFFAQ